MHTQCWEEIYQWAGGHYSDGGPSGEFSFFLFPKSSMVLTTGFIYFCIRKIVFSWNIHLQRSLWPEMMSNYKAGPWKAGICLAVCPCRRHFQRPPTPVRTSLWLQVLQRTSVSPFYGYAKMLSMIKAASRNKSLLGLQFQRASLWLS